MADLVSGGFPQNSPAWSAFGRIPNATQPNIPARTNLEFLGGTIADTTLGSSGVATAVAIPMDPGTVISRITFFVGGTAASTPTHAFMALYSGIATPALIGTQSTDTTTTAIAASAIWTATITPYRVLPADCPNGYIYAVGCQTGTGTTTVMSVGTPTAVNIQYFTAATTPAAVMPMWAATSGSALGATAPATLTLAAKAAAPVVVLT